MPEFNARSTKVYYLIYSVLTLLLVSVPNCSAQAPAGLQISSPTSGTILAPGQSVNVTAISPAGLSFTNVAILGQSPIGLVGTASSVPATATAVIPANIRIGKYMLSAVGVTASGQVVQSDPILISVERSDVPTKLIASPKRIALPSSNQTTQLEISATFSDGNTLDITESGNLSYKTSSAAVATIGPTGAVSAVGSGTSVISATYNKGPSIAVPISVSSPPLSFSPASVSFGSLNVGTHSAAQTVTLTNVGKGSLGVKSISAFGDYSETDNCLTSSPLAVGSSCTVSVVFSPTDSGSRPGNLSVSTSTIRSALNVPLTGVGSSVSGTPSISSVSPSFGAVSNPITITGTGFGATRGTSAVTFNGIVGAPTSWSDSDIAVPVPSGATTGTVFVTVGGVASNGVGFTVERAIQSITVTPILACAAVGGTQQFTATGKFSDGSTQNVTNTVSWMSSDTSSVTVNATGLATALSLYGAGISASSGNVTGNQELYVTANGQPEITIQTSNSGRLNGNFYTDLVVANPGTGVANNLTITSVVFRTLSGTGTVTLNTSLSPALPDNLGSLNACTSETIRLYFNVPAGVTRFSVTENGNLTNSGGTGYNFSSAQAIHP
jgi:hypothetical protein